MRDDLNVGGEHYSQVVAPVLAAFTLPTIALIVTLPSSDWRNVVLFLFVASTGLLLASFQLAVGSLFRDTPGWGAVRGVLGGIGLICLTLGLVLLVWLRNGGQLRGFLDVGSVFLAAGVLVPIGMTVWLRAEGSIMALGRSRFHAAERMKKRRRGVCLSGTVALSDEKSPGEADLRRIFSRGGDYYRIYALKLMQDHPQASSVDCILYSLCRSRSLFEQQQARLAATKVPVAADRRRIHDEVLHELGFDGLVELPRRRCLRVQKLLEALNPAPGNGI